MKALFTTTILLLISLLTFSQSIYQIADTTKEWNTVYYGFGSGNIVHCGGTKTNILSGEVLINDTTFLNVYESQDSLQQNWDHVGFLSEDTVSKKVYITEWIGGEVGLIYDFDLLVGDSVIINNYYAGFENVLLICDNIDSLNINGLFLKRFFLYSPGYWNSDIWIEGIGSKFGLLYSGFNGSGWTGGSKDLLCCSKDDTLIYMDSVYNSCYIEEFYPKIVSEYYDTAYLNNNYEFQVQISDTNNIDSFALIGNVIPEGFIFNEETGLLTGMPTDTGSFPCIITIRNYDIGFLTDMLYENITVELVTTTQNNSNQIGFKIHPNPFDSYFHITNIINSNEIYQIEIYDNLGKIIDKKTVTESNFKIDCINYKKGIYYVKITDSNDNIIIVEKIIKK